MPGPTSYYLIELSVTCATCGAKANRQLYSPDGSFCGSFCAKHANAELRERNAALREALGLEVPA